MREPGLLVGHGLGARRHRRDLGLVELVGVPDAVLGDPGGDIARAAPEDEPVRGSRRSGPRRRPPRRRARDSPIPRRTGDGCSRPRSGPALSDRRGGPGAGAARGRRASPRRGLFGLGGAESGVVDPDLVDDPVEREGDRGDDPDLLAEIERRLVASDPDIDVGSEERRARHGLLADQLAVQVEFESRGRIEGAEDMVPGIERQADVRSAFLPSSARGNLEPEPALGIDTEEIAGPAVLFLVGDRAPGPGIGLQGDPGFDRERPADPGHLRGGSDDGRGLAVETEGLAGYATNDLLEPPDFVPA